LIPGDVQLLTIPYLSSAHHEIEQREHIAACGPIGVCRRVPLACLGR